MLALLAGFVVLTIGSLSLSAILVSERVSGLKQQMQVQSARLDSKTEQYQVLQSAKEMLVIRSERIDWAPKLAALSGVISRDLILVQFDGEAARGKTEASLELWGEGIQADVQIGVFTELAESLGGHPRYLWDFPDLRLGTVQGGRKQRFQIVAGRKEGRR